MSDYKVEHVLKVGAELGECPIWSVEAQALLWEDIHKKTINRFDPKTGTNRVWNLPAMPGCFALRDGDGVIIAARDGVYDLDLGSGALRKICPAPYDHSIYRFNDGKVDRQGLHLWVGAFPADFMKVELKDNGVLYRFDGKTVEPRINPITIPNGAVFSPDGKIFYRAETIERRIYAYDYDGASGEISNERVFAQVPDTMGMPDGATVDTEGGYWPALPSGPRGGGVARFTPDGKLDFHIPIPTGSPTMPAFGGPNMSTLYLTSASGHSGPDDTMAGDLFAIETPFKGIPEPKFKAALG